jgi:hypothetical protein
MDLTADSSVTMVDDLTDDQLLQLLKDAEQRLKHSASNSLSLINTESQLFKSIAGAATR